MKPKQEADEIIHNAEQAYKRREITKEDLLAIRIRARKDTTYIEKEQK